MKPSREGVGQEKEGSIKLEGASSVWRWIVVYILGFSTMAIFVVLFCLCSDQHNRTWSRTQIYIIPDSARQTQVADSVDVYNGCGGVTNKQILEELRGQGELMSSDEFASRITSYYNTLVAVLGIMVAVFTFASSFLVSNFYRNEFERERLRIVADLEEGTIKKVSCTLRDSIEVRRAITEAIRGDIDADFTRVDTTEDVIKQLTNLEQRLSDTECQLADLQETVPLEWEVVDGDAGKHGDHGC